MTKFDISAGASSAEEEDAQPSQAVAVAGQPDASDDSPNDSPVDRLLTELKACSRTGDVQRAEELFALLRAADGEGDRDDSTEAREGEEDPTVEAYNFLIHACATKKDPDRAEHFIGEMEASGVKPTPITYNSVINACAAAGDAGRAQGWLQHMTAQGLQPTQVTYGTLCKVFARQGLVSQVRSIMEMSESGGGQLNEYFFASLISACGAAEPPDPKGAVRAFNDLVSRGLRPQSVKRALERVVGVRQTAQMFAHLGKANRNNGSAKSSAASSKRSSPAGSGGGPSRQQPPSGRRATTGASAGGGVQMRRAAEPAIAKSKLDTPPATHRSPARTVKGAAPDGIGKGEQAPGDSAPPAPPRPAKKKQPAAAGKPPAVAAPADTSPALGVGVVGGSPTPGEVALLSFARGSEPGIYGAMGYVPGARLLASAAYPLAAPLARMAVYA